MAGPSISPANGASGTRISMSSWIISKNAGWNWRGDKVIEEDYEYYTQFNGFVIFFPLGNIIGSSSWLAFRCFSSNEKQFRLPAK